MEDAAFMLCIIVITFLGMMWWSHTYECAEMGEVVVYYQTCFSQPCASYPVKVPQCLEWREKAADADE